MSRCGFLVNGEMCRAGTRTRCSATRARPSTRRTDALAAALHVRHYNGLAVGGDGIRGVGVNDIAAGAAGHLVGASAGREDRVAALAAVHDIARRTADQGVRAGVAIHREVAEPVLEI